MTPGDRRSLAKEIARYRIDLEVLIDVGTLEEKEQSLRNFIASIGVDGENRKIKVGYYDQDRLLRSGRGFCLKGNAPKGDRHKKKRGMLTEIGGSEALHQERGYTPYAKET